MATIPEALQVALKFLQAERLADAQQIIGQILAIEPRQPDALQLGGVIAHRLGQPDQARDFMTRALAQQPGDARLHHNFGCILKDQGKFDQARGAFQRALALKPNFAEAWYNLGTVFSECREYREAADCYQHSIRHDSADAEGYNNLGTAYKEMGQLEASVQAFEQSLRIRPDYLIARFNLGIVRMIRHEFADALETFRSLIAVDPATAEWHMYSGMVMLLQGRMSEGWPAYEWRIKSDHYAPDLKPYLQPRWQGESLAGKTILLHGEQGLGDSIQFIRYAALLKKRGARVLFRSPRSLLRLFESCPHIDQLLPEAAPLPPYDYYSPLMSVPYAMQTTLDTIPADIPYLAAHPQLVAWWREKMSPVREFRVGINWRGNQTKGPWQLRDMPVELLVHLAHVPNVRLIRLQKGEPLADESRALQQVPHLDFTAEMDTQHGPFMDTAALMTNLDLVITSDTSIAHLAGALGVPVWVALPYLCDWRWLLDRSDSPWYPGIMKLFRQPRWGAWQEVIDQIRQELTLLAGRSGRTSAAGQGSAVEIDSLMSQAIRDYEANRFVESENACRELLRREPRQFTALHLLSIMAIEQLRYQDACDLLNKALEIQPRHAIAWNNLGTAHEQLGRIDEATACYRRGSEIDAGIASIHYNLARLLRKAKAYDEAIGAFRRAIEIEPRHFKAWSGLGNALLEAQRRDEAVASFLRAIEIEPGHLEAINDLGNAYREQGNRSEAENCYRRVLQASPAYAPALNNLGALLKDVGRLEEAALACREAVRIDPRFARAWYNLGTILKEQKQNEPARSCFEKALEFEPAFVEALNNLGNIEQGEGGFDEALARYRRARELKPDFIAAYRNEAITLREARRTAESIAPARTALALDPLDAESHMTLAFSLLDLGEWLEAWPHYERRLITKPIRPVDRRHVAPTWRGESLEERTLVVYSEQGLGDTIQFIRYLGYLPRTGLFRFECPAALEPLLSLVLPPERLTTDASSLKPDYEVALLSLPGIFGTTPTNLPRRTPYLRAKKELIFQWRDRLAAHAGFRIGINWQGSQHGGPLQQRDIPLELFAPLARLPGVQLISLQKGAPVSNEAAARELVPLLDFGDEIDGENGPFMDTAAIMQNLDLVITSDTSVAHLAGALAIPVWVALPFSCDWRWLAERDDSPWYPTMRLFRQSRRGEWLDVFERIASALGELVAAAAVKRQPLTAESKQSLLARVRELEEQRLREDAIAICAQILEHEPDDSETLLLCANLLKHRWRLQEAESIYRRLLLRDPHNAEVLKHLAVALANQARFAEAEACNARALAIQPEFVEVWSNLGNARMAAGKLTEARQAYEHALKLSPDHADVHVNYSQLLLLQGEWERGFAEYEWRWKQKLFTTPRPAFSQPEWKGEPLAGKTLLLYSEQGLGDTLQFVRYAYLAKELGARIVLSCQHVLLPLMKSLPCVDQFVVRTEPPPPFDYYIPLMSLPRVFQTRLHNTPARVPYLFADPQLVERWQQNLAYLTGFRVGINWHGRSGRGRFILRNLPLEKFRSLGLLPGVDLIRLQKDEPGLAGQLEKSGLPLINFGDTLDTEHGPFMDTAAIMRNLDLVITCDTSIAHLAGALGVPVWLPLPFAPDWRWLNNRDDNPWYPTMRLFRQTRWGEWDDVFMRMRIALREKLGIVDENTG